MLALRSHPVSARTAPIRSRRHAVRVAAWAGDNSNPFAGLLRFFAPDKYIESKEDWTGTGSNFKGKISHSPRRPFKDGFINKLPKTEAGQQQVQAQQAQQEGEGALGYLNEAAERVVGHNFTGDETEPDWSKTGHKGYKGTPRRPKTSHDEGPFHNRVL